MQISHKNHKQISLLSLHCRADSLSSLINSKEKQHVTKQCLGNGINIIDCRHSDAESFIRDAGGLDLMEKRMKSETMKIDTNLPVITPDCFEMRPEEIDSDTVVLRLRDVLSVGPWLRYGYYALSDEVRLKFDVLDKPIFKGKKTILSCTERDVIIEKLWWLKYPTKLFEEIAAAKFHAVVGMNFSLFIGECPFGHLINLNKSLRFCQELSSRGVKVIPHVYAVNDWQRKKLTQYINANQNIYTIAINTQLQRDWYSKHQTRLTIQALINETSVNILLVGRRIAMELDRTRIFQAKQSDLKTAAIIKQYSPRMLQFTIKTDSPDSDLDLSLGRQTALSLPFNSSGDLVTRREGALGLFPF